MRTNLLPLLSLCFLNCLQVPSGPDDSRPEIQEPPGRPLGHIQSLYPVLAQDGQTWNIEIQLDSLTMVASLPGIQGYASDSLGKALLRSRATDWYYRETDCLFAVEKEDCLDVGKSLPADPL
jgi:hypothetical protein